MDKNIYKPFQKSTVPQESETSYDYYDSLERSWKFVYVCLKIGHTNPKSWEL
jgi:hypothetical protein